MKVALTRLALLGSTGSIGTSTLDVVRRWPDRFQIFALAAGRNLDLLVAQIKEFKPEVVVIGTESDLASLRERISSCGLPRDAWPDLLAGDRARVEVATAAETDYVVSAIVGVAGLKATYEAVRKGKRVGLANKETLVSGGALVMSAAAAACAEIIPIDSEHNGAHQCLRAGRRDEVTKLILTASGGPFRKTPKTELASVTPEQALNHPTWKMGPRITIDSATLMNKGFEVIEACWLFDFAPKEVEVVVHPQSKVHAMVEYNDGSVVAQVCATDMRMPIQYALTYPERAVAPVPRLNWQQACSWDFEAPDFDKFPLLRLAYQAQETGGSAGCTLNAADEIAVEAFLAGAIPFTGISEVVEESLARVPVRRAESVEELLAIDQESRTAARHIVAAVAERRAAVAVPAAS